MSTLTLRATGNATPDEIWDRYARYERWPTWAPQIRAVRVDGGAPRIGAGATGTVDGIVGPPVRFEITAVDEAALTWSWTARLGPLHLRLTHGVHERSTWLRIIGPLPIVAAYAPIAHLALRRLVAG